MAYKKSPFKMSGKSPFMKALVGKQNNLPDALKEKILASPAKQTKSQMEEYRSKSEYLNPKTKKRKNVSDQQVIKEIESQESTMGRAKFKTKGDVKAVQSMQALSPGKYDDLFEAEAIKRFKKIGQVMPFTTSPSKKSPVKQIDDGPVQAEFKGQKETKGIRSASRAGGAGEGRKKADRADRKSSAPRKMRQELRQANKSSKASPAKQKDIKIKDLPDEAVKTGKKIVKGVKKLGKKIGNIKISTKEGQKRRQERRDLRAKQKAEKNSPAKKYGKSPAKKKGCSKKY
tara:strand:- start:3751 stop:4611 length:861 start_codon:yes stop_codon:yes gene_type:complete